MAAQTLFEKIWNNHVVRESPGEPALLYIDLHLIHEVTSPQAFEGMALARAQGALPERTFATLDHNVPDDRPQPADYRSRLEGADRDDAQKLPRLRGAAVRSRRPRAGHRARHRSRTGAHAAGHDDRMRRQPYRHSRRVGRAGVRHRHQRSRARAGDAMPVAGAAEDDGNPRRRQARHGRRRQGPDPRHHRARSRPTAAPAT